MKAERIEEVFRCGLFDANLASKLIASLEARVKALEAAQKKVMHGDPMTAPVGATKEQSSPRSDPPVNPEEISDGQYIEAARRAVQHLVHISIDENQVPCVERTDDGLGAYVSAQIWVPITTIPTLVFHNVPFYRR